MEPAAVLLLNFRCVTPLCAPNSIQHKQERVVATLVNQCFEKLLVIGLKF